ncbi:unnamed protein product [Oreochromis niloticus]|nr:unnamed protein product [Mustela putorius furo]
MTLRCVYLIESIFDRYTRELPDTPDMMDIPNHVHCLQALVEYSLQDEVRAKVLLSLVGNIDPYLYQDLAERGPRGKTERKLTQLKLTDAAERMIGSTLPSFQRAVREGSFLDKIMTVDDAVDLMVQEQLILPDEQYMLYHIYKSTAGKVRAIRYLFGCPTVPDETKASISLILAVYNLHVFGIFTNDPDSLLEIVSIPSVGATVV